MGQEKKPFPLGPLKLIVLVNRTAEAQTFSSLLEAVLNATKLLEIIYKFKVLAANLAQKEMCRH